MTEYPLDLDGGVFYLLDPSFKGARGGSMTFGSGMAAAADQLHVPMKMAVNSLIEADQMSAYKALPAFTVAQSLSEVRYRHRGCDMGDFFEIYQSDLMRLSQLLTPKDVLWDYYLLGPMQVVAYANWLASLPASVRPRVLAGVDVYYSHWLDWLGPAKDTLRDLAPWFRITTTSYSQRPVIERDLGVPVQYMPRPLMSRVQQGLPLDAGMVDMARGMADGPLVGFFTDAHELKSFHLLYGTLAMTLEETDLTFLIQVRHGPVGDACAESYRGLQALAAKYPDRVRLIDGPLPTGAYKTALELCDCVIIAYDPESHFAGTPSGTMCEAFAAGTLPLVIEGSSMAKELTQFGIGLPVAKRQDVPSLVALLADFADNHKTWSSEAAAGIAAWNDFQSYGNMFRHLFDLAWVDDN